MKKFKKDIGLKSNFNQQLSFDFDNQTVDKNIAKNNENLTKFSKIPYSTKNDLSNKNILRPPDAFYGKKNALNKDILLVDDTKSKSNKKKSKPRK
jgi:hypothetical protein